MTVCWWWIGPYYDFKKLLAPYWTTGSFSPTRLSPWKIVLALIKYPFFVVYSASKQPSMFVKPKSKEQAFPNVEKEINP